MSSVVTFDLSFERGVAAAEALGRLLSLDPAEAAARNARICELTAQRRARRDAREAAQEQELSDREARARRVAAARVDAAGTVAALAAAGLAADPELEPPAAPASDADWEAWCDRLPAVRSAALARATAAQVTAGLRRLAALAPPVAAPAMAAPAPHNDAAVERILATLDPLVAGADRDRVLESAADVHRRPDESPARLRQLRLRVQQANAAAAGRRDDAVVAAQLLDAIEPYAPGHGLDPDRLTGARAALSDVVAGSRGLDDAPLDDVEALRAAVEATALARTVTGAVTEALGELGYSVGPAFSLGEPSVGLLEVAIPDRPDHSVRLRVDAKRRSLAAVVQHTGEADAEVEAAWCADLDRAVERLRGSGLDFTPTHVTPPGRKAAPSTSTRPQHREREL